MAADPGGGDARAAVMRFWKFHQQRLLIQRTAKAYLYREGRPAAEKSAGLRPGLRDHFDLRSLLARHLSTIPANPMPGMTDSRGLA
jgi:hypothetical protein